MSRYTLLKASDKVVEFLWHGMNYHCDYRKGEVALWNISIFIDGIEETVLGRKNFNSFKLQYSNGYPVAIKQILKINKQLNSQSHLTDSTFYIRIQFGKPGKTSFSRLTQVWDRTTNELLAERLYKATYVDTKTHKAISIPDWYREQHSKRLDLSKELQFQPVPQPTNKTFNYNFIVRWSDLGINDHINHSVYLKFCLDCASEAVHKGYLFHFTGEMLMNPVQFVRVDCLGEIFVGDTLTVSLWQRDAAVHVLNFLIIKQKGTMTQPVAFVQLNFDLEQHNKVDMNKLISNL